MRSVDLHMRCVDIQTSSLTHRSRNLLQCVSVCCSVLQSVYLNTSSLPRSSLSLSHTQPSAYTHTPLYQHTQVSAPQGHRMCQHLSPVAHATCVCVHLRVYKYVWVRVYIYAHMRCICTYALRMCICSKLQGVGAYGVVHIHMCRCIYV